MLGLIPFLAIGLSQNPEEAWWAKELATLKRQGILMGYPDGHRRNPVPSRYEAAVAVNAAYTNLHNLIDNGAKQNRRFAKGETSDTLDEQDARTILLPVVSKLQRLVGEFRIELGQLGVDVKDVDAKLRLDQNRLTWMHFAQYGEAKGPFPDVKPGHWAYGAVRNMRAEGVLQGYPAGTFREPKRGESWWMGDLRALKRASLISHMPGEGTLIHGSRPPSNWEGAVATSEAYESLRRRADENPNGASPSATVLARLIEAFPFELKELGLDVPAMRETVRRIQARPAK